MKKTAEPRRDSLNELVANFSREEFTRVKEYVERKDRATAPANAASLETAPARSASIGMFMPLPTPSYGAVKIWRCKIVDEMEDDVYDRAKR